MLPNMYIHVAASGEGKRILPAMKELGFEGFPKHLLPTGEPEARSLLSRATENALDHTANVKVHVNRENRGVIAKHLSHLAVPIVVDQDERPLGPFTFAKSIPQGGSAASVAGDVFIDGLDWSSFLEAHTQHEYPVSFLVGRVNAGASNAVFDVAEVGRVERFRRLTDTEDNVFRNIGVYAFTLTEPVVEILQRYERFTAGHEDQIVLDLVAGGLVRAHEHVGKFFNINGAADYEAMRTHAALLAPQL